MHKLKVIVHVKMKIRSSSC